MVNAATINVGALLELSDRERVVTVGDDEMILRTANLLQDAVFLEQVTSLDLDKVFGPVADLLQQFEETRKATVEMARKALAKAEALDNPDAVRAALEELSDTKASDNINAVEFMSRLREVAPSVWLAARPVLGKQLVPVISRCAVVMLDTERNRDLLIARGVVDEDASIEADSDDTYLGCAAVRAHVKGNMSMDNALDCLHEVYDLNDYGAALGKLMTLGQAKPEAKKLAKRTPRPGGRKRAPK